ncbi:MAG: hypothetical protein ABI613_00940 [Gemmatimonadota bacterium]
MAKIGFWQYLKAAFNARPFGMWIPPNWIGLAFFGFLGVLNPGFWVIGAGLELGYLATLITNGRFQRAIASRHSAASEENWSGKIEELAGRLSENDQRRYVALVARCRSILEQQGLAGDTVPAGLESQSTSLSRLAWLYLRLLLMRQAIDKVLVDETDPDNKRLDQRIADLRKKLADETINTDLRRSLTSQLDIVEQRKAQRTEGGEKLAFLEAELARIREQVELIREQAVLSTDPELLSQRIDEITTTLGGTSQWIREQQQVYGVLQDLVAEPPPLPLQKHDKVNQ